LAFISAQTINSCRPVKKDTTANIYFKDEANNAIKVAEVILFGTSTGNPVGSDTSGFGNYRNTVLTGSSGLSVFNLSHLYQSGQVGVAILEIKTKKLNKQGISTITIQTQMANEKTIVLQP
jgi:hypothetical protein